MPFFDDGQDPLDTPGANAGGRAPIGSNPPDAWNYPTTSDVIGAAFRQNNPVVSVLDAITQSRPDMTPVPGYDPVTRLSGTPDDDLIEQSLADVNPAQTDARIAKKNAEIQDRQTLSAAGWGGTVASIAAGATDPTWFIPIMGEAHAALDLGVAARAGLGLAEGAVKSTVSEAALQASQVTRTPAESGANIATNTLLMGLIGGGMAMLSPAERATAETGLDQARTDLSPEGPELPAGESAPPPVPEATPAAANAPAATVESAPGPSIVPDGTPEPALLASDLSAASSDQRTMQLSRILLPDNMMTALKETPVIGPAINYAGRVLMNFSPTLRIFSSDSLVAKRAMGDLAETSLRFTQADQGITTARGGVPIDRLVKMQTHDGQLTGSKILRDNFIQYRGLQDAKVPVIQAALQDVRGQAPGKLSFADFKDEVSSAMTNGDVHPNPYVQQAAQQLRVQVLDPVKRLAQRTMGPDGKPMLGDALEPPKGDKSFFPRMWNKQAIAAGYNTIKKTVADWLESEQGIKAAAKDRLTGYSQALRSHEYEIAKIEAKLQGRTDDLSDLEGRQEEITRLNKFAYQRAERLRESQYQNVGGVREPVRGKNIENARGGAVFETQVRGRGNVLADRASGVSATIDDLEQQLIRETEGAKAVRGRIEKEIADWHGDTVAEAKASLSTRAGAETLRAQKIAEGTYEGAGERMTGADSAVDRAVKNILNSDRDLSRQEIESRAAEILNRINAAPDGRLPYDIASGGPQMGPPGERQEVRGALNARDFAIPTSLVKDFVNTDTEHVIASHLRTVIPDVHLTDRFGDVDMTDVFKRLNEEYDAKLATAKTAKQQIALDAERKAMVRDLAAGRDRVRNVYGWELAKTQPNAARIANVARNWNLITDLGTSVFNRLNDATNAVWRHGLMNVFRDGYAPFFRSMVGMGDGFATSARQSMRDMGVGIDSALGHLSHQWGDVIDNVAPGSKFERALAWSAQKAMMVNLHGPWTDGMKTVAGTVASADFLRTAERFANGTQTRADVQRMAQAGIQPAMAERIWKAYENGGGQEFGKGTHVPNTADWTDTQARDVFSAAIARSADIAVLTPGMEKPLWMSSPVVSLLGQYKSFVAAAHEKILISNLQQADGRTLQGLIAALGMGMLSYRAYTLWSGAETSDRPQDWIKEAISRSAMMAWFSEINSMQAKFSGGATDMFRAIGADHPLSRRQSNSALSELLGPTYSRLEGIASGVDDAFHETWTAEDTHKLRQAVWLQNLFAVRRLLDNAEDGFNEQIGVKPLNRDPAQWPAAAYTMH
jgi:hypothetical protein